MINLENVSENGLESLIQQDELLWSEYSKISKNMEDKDKIEQAGIVLNFRARDPDVDNMAEEDFWMKLKKELYALLCTADSKYNDLRRKIKDAKDTTEKYIVAAIAAAIGSVLGIAAGILVPFVALLLLGIIQLNTNAWCKLNEDNYKAD